MKKLTLMTILLIGFTLSGYGSDQGKIETAIAIRHRIWKEADTAHKALQQYSHTQKPQDIHALQTAKQSVSNAQQNCKKQQHDDKLQILMAKHSSLDTLAQLDTTKLPSKQTLTDWLTVLSTLKSDLESAIQTLTSKLEDAYIEERKYAQNMDRYLGFSKDNRR